MEHYQLQILDYDRDYLVAKVKYMVQGRIRFFAMFAEILGKVLDSYHKFDVTDFKLSMAYWLFTKHKLVKQLLELERDVLVTEVGFAYRYTLSDFHDLPVSTQHLRTAVSNMVSKRKEELKDNAVTCMQLIEFWKTVDVDSDFHLKTLGHVFSTDHVEDFEREMVALWHRWSRLSPFPLTRGKDGKEFAIPSMEEYTKKVPACVAPKGLSNDKVQQLDSLFVHTCLRIDTENSSTESYISRAGKIDFDWFLSEMNKRSTMELYPKSERNRRHFVVYDTFDEQKNVVKKVAEVSADAMHKMYDVPIKKEEQSQQAKQMTENNQLRNEVDRTVDPIHTSSKPAEKVDKKEVGEENVHEEQNHDESLPSMEAPALMKIDHVAEAVQGVEDSSIKKSGGTDKKKRLTDQLHDELDQKAAPMNTSSKPAEKVDKEETGGENVLTFNEQNVDKNSPSMEAPVLMEIDNVAEAVQEKKESLIGKPRKVEKEKRETEKVAEKKVGETLLSMGQESDSKSAKKKTDEWTKVGKSKTARNLTTTEHCVTEEERKPEDPVQNIKHILTKKTKGNERGRHEIENASKEQVQEDKPAVVVVNAIEQLKKPAEKEKSTPEKKESSNVQSAAVRTKLSNSQKKKMKREQKRLLEEEKRQKDLEDYRLMDEAVRTDELKAEENMKELYTEKMKLYQQKKGSFDFGDSRLTASNFARFRAEVVYEQLGLIRALKKEKASTATKEDLKSMNYEIDELSGILDKYSILMDTNLEWNDKIVSNILMLKSNFCDNNFTRLEAYCLSVILA